MKQILQSLKSGNVSIEEVPMPQPGPNEVLIKTSFSMISTGTEKMLLNFGRASYIDKARQQPEKVQQVFHKIMTDGILETFKSVNRKLDQPIPLGYSNVGTVIAVGHCVDTFKPGDRVISNGSHAEIVCVFKNLCHKIPDNVTDEEAAFTVPGAIALQGIRLANITFGESVVVIGLGLIGQITAQILKANGCKVLGIDVDNFKLELAQNNNIEVLNSKHLDIDTLLLCTNKFSNSKGVDAVIITASTDSNQLIHQAAAILRKKGRIVLTGTTGLNLSRSDFYEKEISFIVSCSYGPGRYDPQYEEGGVDYPLGYVRWTAQRNFEAILEAISSKIIQVKSLISEVYNLTDIKNAYEEIISNSKLLAVLIKYPKTSIAAQNQVVSLSEKEAVDKYYENRNGVSFIGSGNYASNILLPIISKFKINLRFIASKKGITSTFFGKKYNFQFATTDVNNIYEDKKTNTVIIATQHNTHSKFIIECLRANKNIFVEKPLCINNQELEEIKKVYREVISSKSPPILMIGFNRRFSPYITKIKEKITKSNIASVVIITINAGDISTKHWVQNERIGGGRIIGEVCHFIDLLIYLCGKSVKKYSVKLFEEGNRDSVVINMEFDNGSIGIVQYLTNGSKSYPKERVEVFCGGKIYQLNNYKNLCIYDNNIFNFNWGLKWRQNKGQEACLANFFSAIKNGSMSPIPIEEIFTVTEITNNIALEVRS